jgi:hypothetical protein
LEGVSSKYLSHSSSPHYEKCRTRSSDNPFSGTIRRDIEPNLSYSGHALVFPTLSHWRSLHHHQSQAPVEIRSSVPDASRLHLRILNSNSSNKYPLLSQSTLLNVAMNIWSGVKESLLFTSCEFETQWRFLHKLCCLCKWFAEQCEHFSNIPV